MPTLQGDHTTPSGPVMATVELMPVCDASTHSKAASLALTATEGLYTTLSRYAVTAMKLSVRHAYSC